ncbi:MAG: DUF4242 domain-containing protein [Persicimonas sp.]
MPKFIIEREIPGVGELTEEERKAGARESNAVRHELGADQLQWVESYYTDDKIYCVYIAENEDVLLEHARCLDLPANRISRVVARTDPTTGE